MVDRTPGFFTINQGGTGAAIIQNYNSATDLVINTLATPAKPGQYAIAWGTGLGPDGHSDVDAPQPHDIPINLELFVGGKLATCSVQGTFGLLLRHRPNRVSGAGRPGWMLRAGGSEDWKRSQQLHHHVRIRHRAASVRTPAD